MDIKKTKKVNYNDSVTYQGKLKFVYSPQYNISILGMENFHPFDTKKYGKVYQYLIKAHHIPKDSFFIPKKVTEETLETVHTSTYLQSLRKSATIAHVAEMPILKSLPNGVLQKGILDPMRYATQGTIDGCKLALKHKTVINLSGGYHHAKKGNGEGFCFFADINLGIEELRKTNPDIKVMIVDLDAHQGNGHEEIVQNDSLVYIFDMYNGSIYPHDDAVKHAIDKDIPLASQTNDEKYLALLKSNFKQAISKFKPDFIIYNAGTDIYENDPLGDLKISTEGIIQRDAFMFGQALAHDIPLLMVLSGGYTKESATIISKSITNLLTTFDL